MRSEKSMATLTTREPSIGVVVDMRQFRVHPAMPSRTAAAHVPRGGDGAAPLPRRVRGSPRLATYETDHSLTRSLFCSTTNRFPLGPKVRPCGVRSFPSVVPAPPKVATSVPLRVYWATTFVELSAM
jgi:hypothetical protein